MHSIDTETAIFEGASRIRTTNQVDESSFESDIQKLLTQTVKSGMKITYESM